MSLWQILIAVILLILVGIVVLVVVVIVKPDLVDRFLNKVISKAPYQIDEDTSQNHKALFVVDLHADFLLWTRNLFEKYEYGHIDLPRLIEGNVALQVFGVVTKFTIGKEDDYSAKGPDLISALSWVQRWPSPTRKSLLQRALYQAERLKGCVEDSQGELILIRNTQDIEQLVAGRENNARLTGALLSLEGVHALEGSIDNLDVLYDANFRMIGLTHFFDTKAGGSETGIVEGGLTPFGVELLEKIQQKQMVIDLAHASDSLIDDVLQMTGVPVVVSHTGVQGTYSGNPRNLADAQIRGVADTGGVIGIAMFQGATGGDTVEATARAMKYVADLVGVEHVALGTDFDGVIKASVDVTGLPLLTEALLRIGFSLEDIQKIMGGNALRVLKQVLPAS